MEGHALQAQLPDQDGVHSQKKMQLQGGPLAVLHCWSAEQLDQGLAGRYSQPPVHAWEQCLGPCLLGQPVLRHLVKQDLAAHGCFGHMLQEQSSELCYQLMHLHSRDKFSHLTYPAARSSRSEQSVNRELTISLQGEGLL